MEPERYRYRCGVGYAGSPVASGRASIVKPMLAEKSQPQWVQDLQRWHLLTPLRVFIILLLAVLATMVITKLVARVLRGIFERTTSEDDPRAEARRRALSSSLRAALVGIVWSTAVITIISQLGINIGAFVAVATVIGGAIGFGAQMLIRDVIAGFFVLADDQFGAGDEVDLGHARGTVERVTLRTARLRDGDGTVWYVPHGNVIRVGNMSKSATGPLDVEVSRNMNSEELTEVVAGLSAALVADEHVAAMLAGEPKTVGVMDIRDDRILFRVRVSTQPGRIDEVRRAWRLLVLEAFADGRLTAPSAAPNVVVMERHEAVPRPTI